MFTKNMTMRRDRNPSWRIVESGSFHRIGDSYSYFFNTRHFMWRFPLKIRGLYSHLRVTLKKMKITMEHIVAVSESNRDEISIEVNEDILHIEADKNDGYNVNRLS